MSEIEGLVFEESSKTHETYVQSRTPPSVIPPSSVGTLAISIDDDKFEAYRIVAKQTLKLK